MSGLEDWVLILDDDPWATEITRDMLERHGIRVHSTTTFDAALDAIYSLGAPAVLLLDVVMPGPDGFEVCRRLRAQGALRHTRVVLVTSLDDEASRLIALEAGADDLLPKPLSEPMLLARVRSLMELARLRDRNDAAREYELVLDTIGEGVVMLDAGDRIITANRPARTLLGLPDDPLANVHLPSFIDEHWTIDRGSIGRSDHARIVWTGREPGVAAALEWTSRELADSLDTHAAWTVVVRDVTDSWQRDDGLGRLLRMVGHKLRIPITGVTTSLELLDELDLLDDDAGTLLDIARSSSERLQDTLLRILEYIDAATAAAPAPSAFLIDGRRLREQLEVDPDVDLEVRLAEPIAVDLDLVRRSVGELAANAVAAGAKQLALRVVSNPDSSVTFTMSDDGPGLPRGITARIFEPFYQVDRSGEADGAGLGLAILAAEVEARGGSVGAHAPAEGRTSVWFRLPGAADGDKLAATG